MTTPSSLKRYQIDPSHSGVHFTVRHMVVSKVRGAFTRFHGTLDLDDKNPEASKTAVTIEAASIDTRDEARDTHLRSKDFFDVESHPSLTFTSTKIEKVSDTTFAVTGDLTIRGVTKPITLQAELLGRGKDPWGNERLGFEASTTINRKDFGLTWNQALEAGGVLVGEKVEIEIDLQAVPVAAGADQAA